MTDRIDDIRNTMAKAEDVDLPDAVAPDDEDAAYDSAAATAALDGDAATDDLVRACAKLPLNDFGNGSRFVTHFGIDLKFVGNVGWHYWDGRRWKLDDTIAKGLSPKVRGFAHCIGPMIAKETAYIEPSVADYFALQERAALKDELAAMKDQGVVAADDNSVAEKMRRLGQVEKSLEGHLKSIGRLLTFAKNAGNSGAMSNLIIEAQVMSSIPLEAMDSFRTDVNTESGVLRFTSGTSRSVTGAPLADVTLLPHDRDLLLTKLIPVAYDPNAVAPRFEAFMERIQPLPEMRAFLQRWFGLSMTGRKEQKLAFFYGSGANGKSVLIDIIARILGDYATTAKIESLTGKNKRGGSDATPDLVPLIGARMVRASEPDEGERFQEGLIKELTGGEPILVRALHSDFVEVRPEFKLTISGNHKPEIRGTDDGIWRRVMLVPFDVQIPKAEQIPKEEMDAILWEERQGILNWLSEGLLAYLDNGLSEPDMVLDATREFREESDPVAAFLESSCVVSGDERDSIAARDLGEAFNFWLSDRGEGEWKPRTIALKLKEKSHRWKSPATGHRFTARKSSTMSYDGIRFADIFGQRFREAPRDAQGRILRARSEVSQ